ncbi:MAG: prepilin-type N-terminal cleavage/methylation domain-containing protein [Fischerella sp.]|uniref:hormogonium polysaccharide secretion pseudopilin HpsB n=1 Tax=Fischerella sp. TaxID=1191 RepID=UPI0017F2CF9C|nr:hormogonium polysaccharide secretion pseudopilin HpsB [Fischerella sp.]NWF58006.1 prepilin-type N-terminal cleavage/methylation domain-containing protein [Fischerella sp.]
MKLHVLQKRLPHSCDAGFTIVESLVALLVAAILLAAIAPVLVLSTATRVQSRRVELATIAAKTYVDGVKSNTIADPPATNPITTTPDQYSVPTAGSLTCNTANDYCSKKDLYCVDGDADNKCTDTSAKDLVIQAFRYNSQSSEANNGYNLTLRIYRADGFKGSAALKKSTKQATFTGGIGDRKAPLLEMTTEIAKGQTSYSSLCQRLGGCK